MRKKFLVYFRNLAVVVTYFAVIAGILLIVVSTVVFCIGSPVFGVLGLAAGSLLLWAAHLLTELFALLPSQ